MTGKVLVVDNAVKIIGASNYTGLEVKGVGASRPGINLTNVTQGDLASVYATEGKAFVITSGGSGTAALTLDSSQNATFTGNVTAPRIVANGTANAIELVQSTTGSATYYVMDNTVETGGKRYRFGYSGGSSDKGSFTIYNQTDNITPLLLSGANATFAGAITVGGSINMTDTQPINYGGQTMFNHSGSATTIGDNTNSGVLTIGGGAATFTGLVSGITPTQAANFATKAYVDVHGGGIGPFLPLAGGTMNSGAAITFTVPSGGGSFINVNHTGNEAWTMGAQSGTGADDYLDIGISGGTRTMSWHETGRVGITETNPLHKLSITSTDDTRGILINNTSTSSYAELHLKASREYRIGTGGSATGADAKDNFYIYDADAGSHRVTLTAGGDFGIGQDTPLDKLHVEGGVIIQNGNNLQWGGKYSAGNPTIYASTNYIAFVPTGVTGAASRGMHLTTTGLGIGTNLPVEKLDTYNIAIGGSTITGYSANKLRIDNNGGQSRFYSTGADSSTAGSYIFHNTTSDGSANTPVLTINADGKSTFSGEMTIGNPVHGAGALRTAGQIYIEHQGTNWNETSPGQTRGAIHLDPAGNAGDNTGNAITFGSSDHSGGTVGDAGIYVRSDGSYGTKMYIATTDSYAVGSKTSITIDEAGDVLINRGHLTLGSTPAASTSGNAFWFQIVAKFNLEQMLKC